MVGSELCFTFCLGLSPGCLCLLHIAVNGLFCCGMQWLVFGLCWEFGFFPILRLGNMTIVFIWWLWLLMHPGFGLLLSCFSHARAKNHPELSCGSELCFTSCLGLSPGCLCLLHRAVNGLFCCGMQRLVFGLLRVGSNPGYA